MNAGQSRNRGALKREFERTHADLLYRGRDFDRLDDVAPTVCTERQIADRGNHVIEGLQLAGRIGTALPAFVYGRVAVFPGLCKTYLVILNVPECVGLTVNKAVVAVITGEDGIRRHLQGIARAIEPFALVQRPVVVGIDKQSVQKGRGENLLSLRVRGVGQIGIALVLVGRGVAEHRPYVVVGQLEGIPV